MSYCIKPIVTSSYGVDNPVKLVGGIKLPDTELSGFHSLSSSHSVKPSKYVYFALNYNQSYVICVTNTMGKNEKYKISLPALYALIHTAKKSLITDKEMEKIHQKMSYNSMIEGVCISHILRESNNKELVKAKL